MLRVVLLSFFPRTAIPTFNPRPCNSTSLGVQALSLAGLTSPLIALPLFPLALLLPATLYFPIRSVRRLLANLKMRVTDVPTQAYVSNLGILITQAAITRVPKRIPAKRRLCLVAPIPRDETDAKGKWL